MTQPQEHAVKPKAPPEMRTQPGLSSSMMGVSPEDAHAALQMDAFKELINKLSWVLGSTYRVSYSNKTTAARSYALRMAKTILKDHGYPRSIAK